MAFILGTRRADRLNGTNGSDIIFSLDGDDTVFADAGHDFIDGGAGNDFLDGGIGNDILMGGFGSDDIRGGDGDDVLIDGLLTPFGLALTLAVVPYLNGTPNVGSLFLSVANIPLLGGVGVGSSIVPPDTMIGGNGNDVLVSLGGNDVMDSGNGDDTFLITGPGLKTASGGSGSDTIFYVIDISGGINAELGGGNDSFQLIGTSDTPVDQNVFVDGGDGDDTLAGSRLFVGNLSYDGGAGNDTLTVEGLFDGNLTFDGGDGNDALSLSSAIDFEDLNPFIDSDWQFDGGGGNDTLTVEGGLFNGILTFIGGDGNDTLTAVYELANLAQSSLEGLGIMALPGGGDDIIRVEMPPPGPVSTPAPPEITVIAGDGNDIVEITGGGRSTPIRQTVIVDGGDGDDTFLFGSLFVGLRFFGGSGNDILAPGPSYVASGPVPGWDLGEFSMSEFGNAGEDVLVGGHGHDLVVGGTGDDRAEGGEGDDVLVDWEAQLDLDTSGRRPVVTITADLGGRPTTDSDTLSGDDGNDVLVSLIGNDRVEGGDGNDVIILGPVVTVLDTIEGGLPNIHLNVISPDIGAAGQPVAFGGAGNDQVAADFGSIVFGDNGDDTITIVSSGRTPGRPTTVEGGEGNDAIRVEMPPPGPVSTPVPPEIAVLAGDGNDIVEIAGGGRSTPIRQTVIVDGGDGDDVVNAVRYDITAGAPGVAITGGDGNDTLTGTNGNDGFNGGLGIDILTGNAGNDIFEYDEPVDGPDVITDFTPGDDMFHMDLIGFGGGLSPGPLAADRFIAGSDPVPVAPGDGVFLYDTDSGVLAWDADGPGGNLATSIVLLSNTAALSASDFLIV